MRMVRKQIQFTRKQATLLRREATRRKLSESEIVRDAVDKVLAPATPTDMDERWARALASVGKFASGLSDVSTRHDDYYADAIYEHLQEHRVRPS